MRLHLIKDQPLKKLYKIITVYIITGNIAVYFVIDI